MTSTSMARLLSIPFEQWGVSDVATWLESEGFGPETTERFIYHKIRGVHLKRLTDRNLEKIGIDRVGLQLDLLDAIKKLPSAQGTVCLVIIIHINS